MQEYNNLSTKDISKILLKVANDVSAADTSSFSKPMLEKCNMLLRVAKHGIQTLAVMTMVAKMRGLEPSQLDTLPHIETENLIECNVIENNK